ncbi:TM0106 family RecB-like putative nuclease [Sediminivirga luteola]|uniref:TM0106 family RecB-like putative nuclease n=1 Tax=Sediminivirga luteola TaxID=1774748 RepID=UPI001F55F0F8|nr:TM0106 family RecB-like putative nuclease [Sediminivirga luteola]
MFRAGERIIVSASDIAAASGCAFATARRVDALYGRGEPVPAQRDEAMLARTAQLGAEHERRLLLQFQRQFGTWLPGLPGGVHTLTDRPSRDPDELRQLHEETLTALRSGVDVVCQATFFDGEFSGRADFLIRADRLPTLLSEQASEGPAGRPAERVPSPPDEEAGERRGANSLPSPVRIGSAGTAAEATPGASAARDPSAAAAAAAPAAFADQIPVYAVVDAKLARSAKVSALLQLGAYAEQLQRAGIAVADHAYLVLGTGSWEGFRTSDILPVYRERRAELRRLIRVLMPGPGVPAQDNIPSNPVTWGDPRFPACGRCEVCEPEVHEHDDLLLVAGMRMDQRKRLHAQGIASVTALARRPQPPAGVPAGLWHQARIQHGAGSVDGVIGGVAYLVQNAAQLGAIPAPSQGDVFFDFEGDPLYTEPGGGNAASAAAGAAEAGLEYLFGVMETPEAGDRHGRFVPFWAHSRAEERQALSDFLDYVRQRRERWPDMRIYHYAPYENAALKRLASRHGLGEDAVDELLREGVLVDLYPVVRKALRVSQRSYSIKKLEPLYMGDEYREADVQNAADSVVAYAEYCAARDAGRQSEAARILEGIREYNRYDCLSTLRLRDWLLTLAAERGIVPGSLLPPRGDAGHGSEEPEDPALLEKRREREAADAARARAVAALEEYAGPPGQRTAEQQAAALVAAAVEFYRREEKPQWWAHFSRLTAPAEDLAQDRDVFTVTGAEVLDDWHTPPRARLHSRRLLLRGRWAEGSAVRPGASVLSLYEDDVPGLARSSGGGRAWLDGTVIEELESHADGDVVIVKEKLKTGMEHYAALPSALAPGLPLRTDGQKAAVAEAAGNLARTLPELPDDCALDILRRRPPVVPGGLAVVPSEGKETGLFGVAGGEARPAGGTGASSGEARPAGASSGEEGPAGGTGGADRDARPADAAGGEAAALGAGTDETGRDSARSPDPEAGASSGFVAGDHAEAIVQALRAMTGSYLAVQGPPGTGKTYTGSRVIAALVRDGWRIGVVGQSHSVVENMLIGVIAAGVPRDHVAKKAESGRARKDGEGDDGSGPLRLTKTAEFPAFLNAAGMARGGAAVTEADDGARGLGRVIGGTVWDFVNPNRFEDKQLDLLVIDEAGQFSLANTLAVSRAAQRLLLLGDPQQLPQVSQGLHPEPVDASALGWLAAGHDTLPAEFGYFLGASWRMHPDLCRAVSRLSYEGRLRAAPAAAGRRLEGIAPGVHTVLVEHEGNATASAEEAAEAVRRVRALLGTPWDAGAAGPRPLGQQDILIVAAYNAQVGLMQDTLAAEGLDEVAVGTVDKFQGRQAPVVLVSMAASSPEEVPRGMEFLLSRNRINVAISRAQWAAYILRSPRLTAYLPSTPRGLGELGAFIGLGEAADPG